MAAEQPEKRRGTNWVEARDYWLALDLPRSFESVARTFAVSAQRVGFIARRDRWAEIAADVDARALEQSKRRAVRTRADRVTKVLGIIDGLVDRYDAELAELELKPADLDRVVKLGELLEGEATDRVSFAELQEALGSVMAIAVEFVPAARRAEFLSRVRDRLGSVGGDS